MTDPIDYSRPVGWWCPVCGASGAIANKNYAEHYAQGFLVCGDGCGSIIRPVYLPIPEGQRPPAASEVEDAEVVTAQDFGSNLGAGYCVMADVSACIVEPPYGAAFFWARSYHWPSAEPTVNVAAINRIAQASARARIVTGATE